MSAFAAAVSALFADPNMSVDAARNGVPLRVILSRPDEIGEFGGGRILSATLRGEVMIAAAPDLAAGDTLVIAGAPHVVHGTPVRDVEGLTFSFDLVPG